MTIATEEQAPLTVPDSIDPANSADSNVSSFSQKQRFELADLLRDCAALVEQNEMDQKVFQRMFRELTDYVSTHGGGKIPDSSSAAAPSISKRKEPSALKPFDEPAVAEKVSEPPSSVPTPAPAPVKSSSARKMEQPIPQSARIPPSARDPPSARNPPSARKVTTTTTKHIPPPAAPSTSSRSDDGTLSKDKNLNLFTKIKSVAKEAGHEFTHIAHTGQRKISEAAAKATSAKNAQRARHDIASELGQGAHADEWCEEHFTMGCACKQKRRTSATSASAADTTSGRSHATSSDTATRIPANPSKPPFQRPVNPNSTLIANGWLEQQRRSKMRFVWKEVLVSLVAGRRPGEETTLWVQRETTNPITGTTGLEALHQIPIKGMQDVNYVDFSTDHRFIIQVYNLSDEFVFRTRDNGDAAKNWVSTLRLTREAVLNGVPPPKPGDLQGASVRTKTHPSYSEDEKKAESPPQQHQEPPPQPQSSRKVGIKELRTIAHAHGVNTAGMERSQLEAAVAKIKEQNGGRSTPAGRTTPAGQPPASAPKTARTGSEDETEREAQRRAEAERRARQVRTDEEAAARMAAEERDRAEADRRRTAAEQQHKQAEAARQAEYLRQQEIHRQQQAQAAAQAKWQEDQRRYQQQQQYYAQQQAAAAQQQAQAAAQAKWQEDQRRAEEQRRYQQQQYYAQQQAQQQQQYHRQQTPPPPQAGPQPSAGGPPPGQPNKWANMANAEDDGLAAMTAIKHHILIKWALQPPNMQVLRPIQGLLTAVHTVFPPTQGVPGHDYFKKWKTLSMESLSDDNGQLDESKLAKAVKKLRFFLHPDKLPRDLDQEQSFVVKMLWDVTSDAWEEYEKKKEELDWLNPS